MNEASVTGLLGHMGDAFFLFLYFLKSFFTEIYFRFHNLQFCTPTARLRGGRVPAANWRGGRDLNKIKFIFNRILAPGGACRPPAGRQGTYRQLAGR